jgi:hypothetical protein
MQVVRSPTQLPYFGSPLTIQGVPKWSVHSAIKPNCLATSVLV